MQGSGFFDLKSSAPNETLEVLKKYGDKRIERIVVKRKPVAKNIDRVATWLSNNELDKVKEIKGYDDLFHLYMLVTLDNGKTILIEKNEIVRTRENFQEDPATGDIMDVSINYDTTLNNMFDRAEQAVGYHLWDYTTSKYNCQHFIYTMLNESNLMNLNLENFIQQDLEAIFATLPGWANRIANVATNIVGWYHKIVGTGVNTIQSVLFDKNYYTPAQAKYWLKSNGYTFHKIDETKTRYRFRQKEPDKYKDFVSKDLGPNIVGIFQY